MNDNQQSHESQKAVVEANSALIFQSKEKDTRLEYVSERAKKLVTAVYLVTNLLPSNDPLRLSVREYAIKLISIVGTRLSDDSLLELLKESNNICRKIVEMLEIGFFSGYISEMNFSVLKGEFDLFRNEISGQENFQEEIPRESLKVTGLSAGLAAPVSVKGQVKGQRVDNQITPENKAKLPVTRHVSEVKKESRREAVLSIIRKRGSVSIKDVSSVIVDCGEKTIQRELSALVGEGVLKRTGERRWSVYSLAG